MGEQGEKVVLAGAGERVRRTPRWACGRSGLADSIRLGYNLRTIVVTAGLQRSRLMNAWILHVIRLSTTSYCTLVTLTLIGTHCGTAGAAPDKCRNLGELTITPALTPLPPGAVEPRGWSRDWAIAAKNGLTGHMEEYNPTFRDGWKGLPVQGPGVAPDGTTGWPLEQCAYWLDGLLRLGYVLHDEGLIQKATNRINTVVDGVNRGSPSFIFWQQEMPRDFNSWAHSHMGRALVAQYEATGDKRILKALVRVYRNYPMPDAHLQFDKVSGLCNLDPMLETYRFSGDRRIFASAQAAMNLPGVQASIDAWRAGRFTTEHAVIINEDIRLPALYYLWTGNAKYLEASRSAFAWLNANHMLPHGVVSGEEYLSGVGAFRLTETCNITAQMWSSLWLYRITGERGWGDSIERAFFNAAPGTVARDFKTMCYYQSPNRICLSSLPAEPLLGHQVRLQYCRLGDPEVLCCVGNLNRIVPNYVIHMWMSTSDGGLAATLYGPCDVSAMVCGGTRVKLTCETAYPFEEAIRITVKPERPAEFPLCFRIPGWCVEPQAVVDGTHVAVTRDNSGFARVVRRWTAGEMLTLTLPMSVRVNHGFETEFPPSTKEYFDYIKKTVVLQKRRLPFETVSYGPLLFALPIPDIDPNTPRMGARWQYALDNDAAPAAVTSR